MHLEERAPTYILLFLSLPCALCSGVGGLIDSKRAVAAPSDLLCLTAEILFMAIPLAMIVLHLVLERLE